MVIAFKEIYSGGDNQVRENYINHKHNSEAVQSAIQLIRNLRMKKNTIAIDDDTYDQNMSIYLSILEPLIINDINLDIAYKIHTVKDLCEMMCEQPLPSEGSGNTKSYR